MLIELYNKYKVDFEHYILFLKSGNFYICLNNDAIVMNNIFNYKIKESTNFIKVGFPITSEVKIKKYLEHLKVNYLFINKEIIEKKKFKTNNYSKYNKQQNYKIYLNRINQIEEILKSNLSNKKMPNILNEIESILCEIDY